MRRSIVTSNKHVPPPVELPPRVHNADLDDHTMVAVDKHGALIGESCPWAKYSDYDVECALALRAAGWSYAQIGEKLDMPKSTAHAICTGIRRASIPYKYKRRK
jgi:hypothetical protein